MKKLKIGIPTALYAPTFGLHVNYIEWVAQFGQPILLTPFVDQYHMFDVLFLPGGADISVNEQSSKLFNVGRSNSHLEWFNKSYFYKCINDEKPIIGICRGFQAINTNMGGTLRNLYGRELKFHEQNKDEDTKNSLVHSVNITDEEYKTNDWFNQINVNSIHHQAIDKLADGFKILVKYANVIEAIKHEDLPIVGFQWHPEKIFDEFSKKVVTQMLKL